MCRTFTSDLLRMISGSVRTTLFTLAALAAALVSIGIGPDYVLFDLLIPRIPGELVQGLGVYAAQVLCKVIALRKALPFVRDGLLPCDESEEGVMRVVLAVNKGGSVFGARMAYETAWACGWCPSMAHNDECTWPPQPDRKMDLSYESDVLIAIPMAIHWEEYAFRSKSRPVKCVVLTREPLKRLKSLLQYAWEGGEPALWNISEKMRTMPTWKERVEWAWDNFVRGSMINTHAVLLTGVRRKECIVIRFEDFSKDYDEATRRWLRAWGLSERAIPELTKLSARHDLNRLTPEQRAAHHHISGKSLSKADIASMDEAVDNHAALQELIREQRLDLSY